MSVLWGGSRNILQTHLELRIENNSFSPIPIIRDHCHVKNSTKTRTKKIVNKLKNLDLNYLICIVLLSQ